MSVDKRKRCANFNTEEKMMFLRILQRKGNVIISKVNAHDLETNRLKEEAWAEITDDFNASGAVLRTANNLKKMWQKLKTEAKSANDIEDPVLELVAAITGRGGSGIEQVDVCDSELMYMKSEDTSDCTPSKSRKDLWERIKTPSPPPLNIVIHSESPDEVAPHFMVPEDKEILTPKPQSKRRCPTVYSVNEKSTQKTKRHNMSVNYDFVNERLRNEIEKRSLIEMQKQHMTEEHNIKMKHGELKTKILEAVLEKIQDQKSVDPELLKIITNL